ncbi:MAG: Bug family tripartite tricarboxylate transporter substrate binding protein [Gemmatimonas sp.]
MSPRRLIAGVVLAAMAVGTARADAVEDFYKSKTLKVIVGYGPGGGFDAYARLLADHLPRQLPGKPTAIVQHMPGAATVKAASYIYAVAPQDGTVLGIPNHALALNALLFHETGDGFDPAKFNWVGRLDYIDVVGVVWHETGIRTIADAKAREVIFGATSSGGTSVMTPLALNALAGTRFKLVQGYKDSSEQYLAMERGEIQGMGNAIWSQLRRSRAQWIAERKIVPLYQDGYERSAGLADVPTVPELAANDEDRKVLRLLASTSVVGRSFLTGPGVPADRVKALRDAFMRMTEDAAFRAEAARIDIPLNPLPGDKLQAMIVELGGYPEALLERARRVVKD